MEPITRATINRFCRSCLQGLELNKTDKKGVPCAYDLLLEPHLLRWLHVLIDPAQPQPLDSLLPRSLCYSCYNKTMMFYKFGETAFCALTALRELLMERSAEQPIISFKRICAACFRLTHSIQPSSGALDLLTNVRLQKSLQIITEIDIKDCSNNQPRHLCKNCASKLRAFDEFRHLAQESQKYIGSLLWAGENQAKIPNLEVTETEKSRQHKNELKSGVSAEDTFICQRRKTMDQCSETVADTKTINENDFQKIKLEIVINKETSENETDVNEQKLNEKCTKTIPKKARRKYHQEQFNCERCSAVFRTPRKLAGHLNAAHEKESWQCQICNKNCTSKRQLGTHLLLDHKTVPLKCEYCQKAFKQKHHLSNHIKNIHQKLRPYQCRFCERSFGIRGSLRSHEMVHTGERNFSCDTCQKAFCLKAQLKKHLETHHLGFEYTCRICSRKKASQEELDEHMTKHSNVDGYQCTKCGVKFTRLGHLKDHDKVVHLKVRPFKCNHCQKTFSRNIALLIHERLHTGKFYCSTCDKKFRSSSGFAKHMAKCTKSQVLLSTTSTLENISYQKENRGMIQEFKETKCISPIKILE